jgi:hypothetical protein
VIATRTGRQHPGLAGKKHLGRQHFGLAGKKHLGRLLAASALVAGLAGLSACSAGQITQTSNQVAAVPGANGNTGPGGTIALRNLLVPFNDPAGYPAGGDAPMIVRIFNDGANTVTLVGVTAVGTASGVTVVGGTATPTPTPARTSASPKTSPSATSSATPDRSGTPTGSASPTPGGSPTPSPTASVPAGSAKISVAIPASGYAELVPGQGQYLQLTGLTNALTPGQGVPVTFTFDDGSSITLSLPVGPATAAVSRDPALS